jgi:hypothetical protein
VALHVDAEREIAWNDRPNERERDAEDIDFIFKKYRIFSPEIDDILQLMGDHAYEKNGILILPLKLALEKIRDSF